jgi:hypothetical protein
MDDLVTAHVESLIATVAEQQIRIEALEAALHDAFMAKGCSECQMNENFRFR